MSRFAGRRIASAVVAAAVVAGGVAAGAGTAGAAEGSSDGFVEILYLTGSAVPDPDMPDYGGDPFNDALRLLSEVGYAWGIVSRCGEAPGHEMACTTGGSVES
ncbi:hypothetical protein [Rhodococcus sp. NPDC003348]